MTTTQRHYVSLDSETGAELHTVTINQADIDSGEDFTSAWEQCGEPPVLLTLEEWRDAADYINQKLILLLNAQSN